MNFLAHIYLSGNNDLLKIGNFIADGIVGNKYKHLPIAVQKGIQLHRKIDSFTDTHPIVRKSKKRLHPRYRHYNGVIIDILYDHYLAKNWLVYSDIELNAYTQQFYTLLTDNHEILPEKIKKLLPYMIKDNWLYNYRTIEGIETVLIGMNKRTKNISKMNLAIEDLQLYYTDFEDDFTTFFEDLRNLSSEQTKIILNK
ncbi:acyl carrier protein phosphodiesterase [Aureibaculum luteum]|uniref:acyl carrier protein phosphodiesterase n=1 Tax=Aureibaculum luteum TaxID=1548456 RepID=UPI000E52CFE5|nr:acyl carrier protein phosphodiesterase [Aureibaculum luteum]